MKTFRQMYELTDSTVEFVDSIVSFLKDNEHDMQTGRKAFAFSGENASPASQDEHSKCTLPLDQAWGGGILLDSPQTFLRIALTVDFWLAQGRCPSERDLPQCLWLVSINSQSDHTFEETIQSPNIGWFNEAYRELDLPNDAVDGAVQDGTEDQS